MGYEEDKKRDSLTLEATWWVIDREPGMDDIYAKAGGTLDKITTDLKVELFRDRYNEKRLFLARFEFPKYGELFIFYQAVFIVRAAGFIDFLAGFPIDDCEMLVVIGEVSSTPNKTKIAEATATSPCAPIPKPFFKWPDEGKIAMNFTALARKYNSRFPAKNLEGEPKPTKPHWWFRINLAGEKNKYPVPGEFLSLGVRMMPNKPWGHQKSSPFIYAGNWMDTVYYTSAVITEVISPNDDITYPTYKVKWRVIGGQGDGISTVKPSDFAEYKVGDRVTILKDVATEKKSQLWKDDDMKFFGGQEDMAPADITWQIVPITFYGLDKPEE